MVRANSLPFRLLCRENWADIVYSEEIVDLRLVETKRIVNNRLHTIEYREKTSGNLCFSTCTEERPLIVQLGTSSPETALRAAHIIAQDCDAIDINCGCPAKFSTHSGMGSRLLKTPEKIKEIITALKIGLVPPLPVTCKIRLLPTLEENLSLFKHLVESNVDAIAIHARYVSEHPEKNKARWNEAIDIVRRAKEVYSSLQDIPLILNGDIFTLGDVQAARSLKVFSSFMIGRGAITNFRLSENNNEKCIIEYIQKAMHYHNHFPNTKWHVLTALFRQKQTKSKIFSQITKAKNYNDLCALWPDLLTTSTQYLRVEENPPTKKVK